MSNKRIVKIRYGEKTFLLDDDIIISDFLKSQHLDILKLIVFKKIDDSLVINK